jgi:hypothetical protein
VRRRRRRTGAGKGRWLWLLGAATGAAIVYLFFGRFFGSGKIPVPGEAEQQPTAAPKEEIHPADREQLERVLREHGRAH